MVIVLTMLTMFSLKSNGILTPRAIEMLTAFLELPDPTTEGKSIAQDDRNVDKP